MLGKVPRKTKVIEDGSMNARCRENGVRTLRVALIYRNMYKHAP